MALFSQLLVGSTGHSVHSPFVLIHREWFTSSFICFLFTIYLCAENSGNVSSPLPWLGTNHTNVRNSLLSLHVTWRGVRVQPQLDSDMHYEHNDNRRGKNTQVCPSSVQMSSKHGPGSFIWKEIREGNIWWGLADVYTLAISEDDYSQKGWQWHYVSVT